MNELEKLREELENIHFRLLAMQIDLNREMNEAMGRFRVALLKAREIERQAGIGEEK